MWRCVACWVLKCSNFCPKPQMIFPCVATHYHPLVYQRAQRRLGVDPDVPLDKRKKIVYFTRLVHYDSRLCARVV